MAKLLRLYLPTLTFLLFDDLADELSLCAGLGAD